MFKKIELWIIYILLLLIILIFILFGGILRDIYLDKNRLPETLQPIKKVAVFVAEIPKNIYLIFKPKNTFHYPFEISETIKKSFGKKNFNKYMQYDINGILVLPRYDYLLKRSVVELINLKDFRILHTYKHDIHLMNNMVDPNSVNKTVKSDDHISRFEYRHPLILPDGDLISHSEYSPLFRIDICDNVIWINDHIKFHHSIEVFENILYVPSQKKKSSFNHLSKNLLDDSISTISLDGKIINNESIIKILSDNKLVDQNILNQKENDPIHLNDIEIAKTDTQYWKKGDLFLSSRHLSKIIHYRPSQNKVINYLTGPFSQQHDVDIISDKEILIFNNNNFLNENENSNILIFNFENQTFSKINETNINKLKFKTLSQGLQHLFTDGSLLIEEQNRGRLLLFNPDGELIWEYLNKNTKDQFFNISWTRVIEDNNLIKSLKKSIMNKQCKK